MKVFFKSLSLLLMLSCFVIVSCARVKEKEVKAKVDIEANESSVDSSTSNVVGYDTLLVDTNTVVLISPDSLQIEQAKQEYGEESFYISADDNSFYLSEARTKLISKGFNVKDSDSRVICFDYGNKREYFNTDSVSGWGVVFFNLEKSVYVGDIVDIDQSMEEFLSK